MIIKKILALSFIIGAVLALAGCSPVEETDFKVTEIIEIPDVKEEEIIPEKAPTLEIEEEPKAEAEERFIPERPSDFEGFDEAYIKECLVGENINRIRGLWGEADMSQTRADALLNAYFTETMDVVIYFDSESGIINNAEIIENQ